MALCPCGSLARCRAWLFLATWLYAINRGLVMIAKGVVRIGQKLEPELFGAGETTRRCDDTHLR